MKLSVYVLVQSHDFEGGIPIGVYRSVDAARAALSARLDGRELPPFEPQPGCAVCSDCAALGPVRGFADSIELHHFIVGEPIE